MATVLRDFSVPLALLLIAVMVYLLISGKLNAWSFVASLVAVAAFTLVVGVLLPRSEEISEVSAKVAGYEILAKMQKVAEDVYAKAEAVQRLTEHVAGVAAFNLVHLGRFSPPNLDELLLKERDQLDEMLQRAAIPQVRIQEITQKITDVVARDLAIAVMRALPLEMFATPAAKEKGGRKKIDRDVIKMLMESKVGTAQEVARDFLKPLGGLTETVKEKVAEFDSFRASDRLPAGHLASEEE